MWVTYALTIIIVAAWFSKMIARKRFFIQKTPLDIPIALFLLSQIISTIFSMDQHVSIWGYYSRFNGGLLSMISYITLYYAFVSNFFLHLPQAEPKIPRHLSETSHRIAVTKHVLGISLITGIITAIIVSLWGLPSHFGYDPTCLLFRGTFDVSCWTDAFHPTIRMFSTLGQPNWMAAYLAILLPVALAFTLSFVEQKIVNQKKTLVITTAFSLAVILFYLDTIYTASQSGFVGLSVDIAVFLLAYFFVGYRRETVVEKLRICAIIGTIFLLIPFFMGFPVDQLNKFTWQNISKHLIIKPTSSNQIHPAQSTPQAQGTALEVGGTSSTKIRRIVWTGAIKGWQDNPVFGTGVETFAFAYYKYRPVEHNMTSEWDYLYNKAHNEYLNYLTTTGAFGLGSYILMIGIFIYLAIKALLNHANLPRFHVLLIIGLLSGYIANLVINFFGFSVVITNIYLFLIPAFVFLLGNQIPSGKQYSLLMFFPKPSAYIADGNKKKTEISQYINPMQWTIIVIIACMGLFELFTLWTFWMADVSYALGSNYDHIQQYGPAYEQLQQAINLRGDEPVFKDEMAVNNASIVLSLVAQKDTTRASQFAQQAITLSDQLITDYPNNISFWKSRVRIFYTLSQANPQYLKSALDAIMHASKLAPTDAKISYNLGVLYGQNGQAEKAITELKRTIQLKPNYRDPYFALGLFYHDLAINKQGKVIKPELEQQAVDYMHYILKNIGPDDKQVLDTLKNWGEK